MRRALVSVIIPTFNAGEYILDALNSVFNQTYKNLEVIVVDNGSTDNTKKLLSGMIKKRGIKYFFYPDKKGAAFARNFGISHANGEFVAFLDADDIWLKDKIGKQLKLFDTKTGLIYTYLERFGDTESYKNSGIYNFPFKKNKDVRRELLKGDFITLSSVIMRRSVLDKVGYFDYIYNAAGLFSSVEDYDLWLRITKNYEIKCLSEVLTKYRIHKKQSSNNVRNFCIARCMLYSKFYKDKDFKKYRLLIVRKYIKNRISAFLLGIGALY